ncbi:MAG: hypothetical protein ABIQ31_03280 [Ferruginibacter sp.]
MKEEGNNKPVTTDKKIAGKPGEEKDGKKDDREEIGVDDKLIGDDLDLNEATEEYRKNENADTENNY